MMKLKIDTELEILTEENKALKARIKELEKEKRAWNKVASQVEARFGKALDKMLEGKELIDNK